MRNFSNYWNWIGVVLALSVAEAHAARPMVTDDARLVDAGACQLEAWRRFNRDSKELWTLPACNPGGNLEMTLGSAELPVDDLGTRSNTRTVQIQGKTLFKTLETNGYSYGLAVGGVVRSNGAADQVPNYYAYMPYTRSLWDDRLFVHVNAGVQRAGVDPLNSATWGVGTEFGLTRRMFLIAEVFGSNHTRPSYQGGVRAWLVPNRVQIDATIGAEAGNIGASRWISVGLRLISPAFLK
ncbi:MAG: hypothetical protein ABIS45_12110 [Burkholderiales bacterium]